MVIELIYKQDLIEWLNMKREESEQRYFEAALITREEFYRGKRHAFEDVIAHVMMTELDYRSEDSLVFETCSACNKIVLFQHKHSSFCPNCGAKMNLNRLGRQKPVRYMTPCPNCGGNQIAITGNDVANDGELGVILQERTCESCGKKHHAKLMYRLQGVRPIREEELPKG